jgi:hypothetical protein
MLTFCLNSQQKAPLLLLIITIVMPSAGSGGRNLFEDDNDAGQELGTTPEALKVQAAAQQSIMSWKWLADSNLTVGMNQFFQHRPLPFADITQQYIICGISATLNSPAIKSGSAGQQCSMQSCS